jgi:hypothetical protein
MAHNLSKSEFHQMLTDDIWDEYEGKKCDSGHSFEKSILPCMKYNTDDSHVYLCAGSLSSYKIFNKLFDKVMARNLKGSEKKDQNHKPTN